MVAETLLAALRGLRVDGVGLRDWSVFVHESRGLTLGVKDREVGGPHAPLTVHESCEAHYLLVWDDGRVSRGNLERRQLQDDPSEALGYAREAAYDDPDAAWVHGPAAVPEVEMVDPLAARLAAGDTVPLAERVERVRDLVAERGASTWSGSFSAGDGHSQVATSAGLDVSSRGTTASWHVVLNGEVGDGFGARRPDGFDEFETRLERLFDTVRRLSAPTPAMRGGPTRVLLAPNVVESYVLRTLFENLSGARVAHGESHFRREQFGSGRPVLREDLRLRLDPLQPLRRGSYRCTSEGVPAARCTFIDGGCLLQPVVDLKYARRLGLAPTPLPLALDTVDLEGPPRSSLESALAEADGGVLVRTVLGVHTQDGASGDFSLSAPLALAIARGDAGGRLRGTISGNLFELLSQADLRLVDFEHEFTPGLLVRCRFDPATA